MSSSTGRKKVKRVAKAHATQTKRLNIEGRQRAPTECSRGACANVQQDLSMLRCKSPEGRERAVALCYPENHIRIASTVRRRNPPTRELLVLLRSATGQHERSGGWKGERDIRLQLWSTTPVLSTRKGTSSGKSTH